MPRLPPARLSHGLCSRRRNPGTARAFASRRPAPAPVPKPAVAELGVVRRCSRFVTMMQLLASAGDFSGLPLAPFVPLFMVGCGLVAFFGVVCLGFLFTSRRRVWHGVVFVGSLPFTWLVVSFLLALHQQNLLHPPPTPEQQKAQAWQGTGSLLNSMVAQYFLQHPERFRFPHGDDEAEADGLLEFIKLPEPNNSGFRFRDGKLYSPWGDEVVIVVDHNHKNQLEARGRVWPYHWRDNVSQCALLRTAPDAPEPWSAIPGWIQAIPK